METGLCFYFEEWGVESNWVHWALRPPIGLLYLPRVIMRIDNSVEWWLAGETEVLGENLPQCHFVHHKSHMTWPGANPGRRCGKPATNRLSYGTALRWRFNTAEIKFRTSSIKHYATRTYGGMELWFHTFLAAPQPVEVSGWLPSTWGRFTLKEIPSILKYALDRKLGES
jgi:hypothetical protein